MSQKGDTRWQRAAVAILMIALLLVVGVPATTGVAADEDPPPVPASYYGELWFQDEPAPAGVTVEAEIDGEVYDTITVTSPGEFGGPALSDDKLTVNATESEIGEPVQFYVVGDGFNRTEAVPDGEIQWEPGDLREVNLTVDVAVSEVPTDDSSDDESNDEDTTGNATDEDDTVDENDDTTGDSDDPTGPDTDASDATSSDTDDDATSGTDQDEATDDDATTASDTTSTDNDSTADTPDDSTAAAEEDATSDSVHGFGVVLTLVALLFLSWQSIRRCRM